MDSSRRFAVRLPGNRPLTPLAPGAGGSTDGARLPYDSTSVSASKADGPDPGNAAPRAAACSPAMLLVALGPPRP